MIRAVNKKPLVAEEIIIAGHILQRREINNESEIYLDDLHLDRFTLLALALNTDTKKKAWTILRQASQLYHHRNDIVFNELYDIVAMEVTRKYSKNKI